MTDMTEIERRFREALNSDKLADVVRDVKARLIIEHADPEIIAAVEALELEATKRVYIGARAG